MKNFQTGTVAVFCIVMLLAFIKFGVYDSFDADYRNLTKEKEYATISHDDEDSFENFAPLVKSEEIDITKKEKECLVRNVFHEAGGEPLAGKIAVAQVTLNRVRSERWSNTICGVVYEPNQFSWTKQNKTANAEMLRASERAVEKFISGYHIPEIKNANHYHAVHVSPKWKNSMKQVAVIGNHIFYKG